MSLDFARKALADQAINYASGDITDQQMLRALCEAAKAYTREFDKATRNPPGSETRRQATAVIRFGRCSGKEVGVCDTKDLRWYTGVLEENIEDPARESYKAKNQQLLDAIYAELEHRGER